MSTIIATLMNITSTLLFIASAGMLIYGTATTYITFPDNKGMFLVWFTLSVITYLISRVLHVRARVLTQHNTNQ
tara:strand:+ start:398 stop:619 length:222 start_codon:yes stop_codon:yes gene_type:complete